MKRLTLTQFKKLCDISSRKSDYLGWSWTSIYNHFTDNAKAGLAANEITKSQYVQLLVQRDNLLDRLTF